MENSFIAYASIEIQASTSRVWDALTNPAIIKQYLFGTETVSGWRVGDPIIFKGTWEGKPYEDKGVIQSFEKEKELGYTYWSSFSNITDVPENYMNIRFVLTRKNNMTTLALTQDNCRNEEARKHSEQNWKSVLEKMKNILEIE